MLTVLCLLGLTASTENAGSYAALICLELQIKAAKSVFFLLRLHYPDDPAC